MNKYKYLLGFYLNLKDIDLYNMNLPLHIQFPTVIDDGEHITENETIELDDCYMDNIDKPYIMWVTTNEQIGNIFKIMERNSIPTIDELDLLNKTLITELKKYNFIDELKRFIAYQYAHKVGMIDNFWAYLHCQEDNCD